jgi:hypothetical protein
MPSILSIFQTDPISIAKRQLTEARKSALNSSKLALYHKAESECQEIYAKMHLKHTNSLLSQLEDWNTEQANQTTGV